jgi:hypothetical protein
MAEKRRHAIKKDCRLRLHSMQKAETWGWSARLLGLAGIAQKPAPRVSIACFKSTTALLIRTMRFVIFSSICALVTAQQVLHDPINNFCRRHQHQSCVIDSKLYIDGGLEYFGTSVEPNSQPEKSTYTISPHSAQFHMLMPADTWLLWGDLNQLSTGLPPLYSNLSKARSSSVTLYMNSVALCVLRPGRHKLTHNRAQKSLQSVAAYSGLTK